MVSGPPSIINLTGELPEKEVDDIPRTLAEVQEIKAAKLAARRFISITNIMDIFLLPSNWDSINASRR